MNDGLTMAFRSLRYPQLLGLIQNVRFSVLYREVMLMEKNMYS
jgi:hypothetical protein